MPRTGYLLLLALFAALPSAGLGQSRPSPLLTDTVPLDPAVRYGRLPNGFEYYIRRNADPKDKVELRLVVDAGRFHEDEDQLGLAHLLEHMAFEGTVNYPENAIRDHFDKWGLVPGGDWNASTGRVTMYQLRLPTDKPEIYATGFRILRDWAQDLTLDSVAIDAERGVVLGESRTSENVPFKMQREMEARFLDHPKYILDYRRKHDENIRTFEHETLRRFFRDWYRPDLQALVVVGDVDVDEVEQRIADLFSDLEMPADPREVPDIDAAYDVELKGKNQLLLLTDEDLPNTTVRIYHKRKGDGTAITTVEDYRRALMDRLYNAMMRARLDPLTQRYNVPFESFYHSVQRGILRSSARIDALYTYLAFERSQAINTGVRAALLELERVRRHGFLPSELERARELVRKELAENRQGTSRDLVNRLVNHYDEGAAAPALDDERALQNRLLDDIEIAAINGMIREWLGSTTDRDMVITAPTSEADRLPNEGAVKRWFAEARRAEVEPYREPKPPIDRLMAAADVARLRFDPTYTVREDEEIGTTELRLGNGVTVVLKPLKPVGQFSEEVHLSGSSAGGWRSYDGAEALTAEHAASIVRNAGVGTLDKFELEAFRKSKGVSGGPAMGEDAATVSGTAPVSELETLLQLVHLYLTAPRRDTASFEDWKSRQLAEIERAHASRAAWFRAVIDTARYRGRLANSRPTSEEIGRLRQEDVYRFYHERFTKPGDFVFVLAGAFDAETAVPLLVRYIGSLPSTRADRPRNEGSKVQARMGTADLTLYRGTEDKANVKLLFSGEYTPGLMAKLKLAVLAEALQIRMHERLREKEGGTYYVTSRVEAGSQAKDAYFFHVGFIPAPDNVDHMIGAAVEEIERLHEEGLDPALFEAAVSRMTDSDRQMNSASFWAGYLLDKYHTGEDVTEILKRRSLLTDILTPDAINEAARRYFRVENLMRFVLLPASYQPSSSKVKP